jgi:RNA polymerase sigma factor (sigma-70 family)
MTLPPFQTLVDAHGRDVHRYLRGLVGHSSMDDCFQDALMSALVAYPARTHARNLRSWLFTIAHNKGIGHLRRTGRETLTDAPPDRGRFDADRRDESLWAGVGVLPAKQRAAVTLRYLGDLSYREIAGIIESSEAAARQSVRAGLAALRKESV